MLLFKGIEGLTGVVVVFGTLSYWTVRRFKFFFLSLQSASPHSGLQNNIAWKSQVLATRNIAISSQYSPFNQKSARCLSPGPGKEGTTTKKTMFSNCEPKTISEKTKKQFGTGQKTRISHCFLQVDYCCSIFGHGTLIPIMKIPLLTKQQPYQTIAKINVWSW